MSQFVAVSRNLRRFYNKEEVQQHNSANDIWVIVFNRVFNLTQLIQDNIDSPLCEPLILHAGKNITYWFDNDTQEPRSKVDVETGKKVFYCPQGPFLHQGSTNVVAWWKDGLYMIGNSTKKSRQIRIINTLTKHDDILLVPQEETLNEIQVRYMDINCHAESYTWKRLKKNLDMTKTLEQNGIVDETDEYEELDMPQSEQYIPCIHIYFNDDLTIA